MSEDSGLLLGHFACVASQVKGKTPCVSSDAMAVYEKENESGETFYDSYCWSCSQSFKPDELRDTDLGEELYDGKAVPVKSGGSPKTKAEPMNPTEVKDFIKLLSYDSGNYRGIKDEYSQFFGHLVRKDLNGEVLARYYPETKGKSITGYKCRNHPKDFSFGKVGLTGKGNDLSGQIKFRNTTGKWVLIVGGEEDKVAAYQMLREAQIARGQTDFPPVPVVSPTCGESGAHKQVALQYDWLDGFENIVIGFDNDEAGKEAAKKCAKVLPEHKVKIANWTGKDPNQMLQKGQEKQFVRDFYGAKEFVKTDIKHSSDTLSEVVDFLNAPKIPLPPHLHRLETNMRGGIKSTGAIINLIGDTSVGKSSFTDSMLLYWFYDSPIVPTIVSLERTAGELTADFLSMHLQHNLTWYEDGQDAIDFLSKPENHSTIQDLLTNEYGESRYHILDERSGDMKSLLAVTERAIKQYDSRLIIFDPLTDFLRSLGNEAQEEFMMWEKRMKKEGVIFLNVLHTRKPMPDKDGNVRKVTEYDALGSSSFVQSADANIVINRDKMASCEIDRNSTCIDLPKCRGGITGHVGDIYYDYSTRTFHDKEDYFRDKGVPKKIEEG